VCSLKESLDPDNSILYNDEISHNVWLVFPGCPLESSSPYRHHLIMNCISHTPYFNENESEAVRDRLTVFPMAPSLLWIRSIILVWTHHWSLHTFPLTFFVPCLFIPCLFLWLLWIPCLMSFCTSLFPSWLFLGCFLVFGLSCMDFDHLPGWITTCCKK